MNTKHTVIIDDSSVYDKPQVLSVATSAIAKDIVEGEINAATEKKPWLLNEKTDGNSCTKTYIAEPPVNEIVHPQLLIDHKIEYDRYTYSTLAEAVDAVSEYIEDLDFWQQPNGRFSSTRRFARSFYRNVAKWELVAEKNVSTTITEFV